MVLYLTMTQQLTTIETASKLLETGEIESAGLTINIYKLLYDCKDGHKSDYNKLLACERIFNSESFDKILKAGIVNVNAKNGSGDNILLRACKNWSIPMIKVLLNNGIDVNHRKSVNHGTILNLIIPGNYTIQYLIRVKPIYKLLLDYGADIEAKYMNDQPPLFHAVYYNFTGYSANVVRPWC
jgi:ankyrin repeat protein